MLAFNFLKTSNLTAPLTANAARGMCKLSLLASVRSPSTNPNFKQNSPFRKSNDYYCLPNLNRPNLQRRIGEPKFLSSCQKLSFSESERKELITRFDEIDREAELLETEKKSQDEVCDSAIGRKRPMYMDNQATSPMDPRVLDKMLPLFIDSFGNPHSRTHSYGWEAEQYVEKARKHIAKLINASPREIVFTSGGTESNNMAIKGAAEFYGMHDEKKRHIITTQIEHKCVLAACRYLQSIGWDVTYLPVKADGTICLEELEREIRPGRTLLASVMYVNNEIGVVQPVQQIGEICRRNGVLFHSDAAQAVGKLPIDLATTKIDLLTISGHKIYGPKGIGALFVRSKPRVRLAPMILGGGQERGFRSGTLPAPLIVGLGEACRLCAKEHESDLKHISSLAERLRKGICEKLPDVSLNGSLTERYQGNLNLSFASVEGESLLMSLPDVAVSSGSACTSASLEPSYVLRAIGLNEELAHTSIRFGLGRFSTVEEVDSCVQQVVDQVARLREMSPLWELSQEGDTTPFMWT